MALHESILPDELSRILRHLIKIGRSPLEFDPDQCAGSTLLTAIVAVIVESYGELMAYEKNCAMACRV